MQVDSANPSVVVRSTEPRGRAATARERSLRYLITFACYGGRLHGDEQGSVDRRHNLVGSRLLNPDPDRVAAERRSMLQEPYTLDQTARAVVLAALRQHCTYRGWNLLAAHVRSNHVHAIVEAEIRPERMLSEFKSYASRELNRLGNDGPDRKRWARHGQHAMALERPGCAACTSVRDRRTR